jgi:hypothetical protein
MVLQQSAKQHGVVTHLAVQSLKHLRQLVKSQVGIRTDHIKIKSQFLHIHPMLARLIEFKTPIIQICLASESQASMDEIEA